MIAVSRREWLAAAGAALVSGSITSQAADKTREVPWLADVQTLPATLPPGTPPPFPSLLVDADGRAISTWEAWEQRRAALRAAWSRILGDLGLDTRVVPRLQVLEEESVEGIVRQRVAYEIEPGIHTEAYVLRPRQITGRLPAAAVFHSTVAHSIRQGAGLGPDPQKAFGWKLARRGFVTMSPRNFLWPDNEHIAAEPETKRFMERHPRATGMAKMLYDSIVAVNLLAAMPEVDPERIGAVGHSLGAKEVLYLAAFDERIKATVSSEGGIGIRFSNWDAAWYLGSQVKAAGFGHDHHELLALIAPRAFLLVGGDSADGDRGWPYLEAAWPVYRLHAATRGPAGQPARLGLYNHRSGHAVPPESERRIDEWLETYL